MSKAADVGKASVKGSFHLMWGLVVSTVISSVGTIYLGNLLSPAEMGLYALALAAPTLIGVFRDWGVNSALTRFTAQQTSERHAVFKRILVPSLVFEVVAGFVLTIVSFLLSSVFAQIYQAASIAPLIQIASLTILANAFVTVAQAAFTGLDRMELSSVTLIVQSITKVVLISLLVILGFGVFGAVVGYTIAVSAAGLAGLLLLWLWHKKTPYQSSGLLPAEGFVQSGFKDDIKTLLKYGVPLSIVAIVGAFQTQFYTILMGVFTPQAAVGNYAIASTFVILITFFSTPVSTALFPAFSKLDAASEHEALQRVFQLSVKYASLVIVPIAAIVMALSGPGIYTLFGNKYESAPLFLVLLAVGQVYVAIGSLSVGNLANGQGKTSFNLKLCILGAVIGLPLSFVFALQFGIVGIIAASLVAGFVVNVVGLVWVKKNYQISVDYWSSAKILFASGLAGASAYGFQFWLGFGSILSLVVGTATFVVIFFPSVLLMKTVKQSDLANLRQMTSSLGIASRLLSPVFRLAERFLIYLSRSDSDLSSSLPPSAPSP